MTWLWRALPKSFQSEKGAHGVAARDHLRAGKSRLIIIASKGIWPIGEKEKQPSRTWF